MSGSDARSSVRGTGGIGGGATVCELLAFETLLSSPKPAVVQQLSVGDYLEVVVVTNTNGIDMVVVEFRGQTVGGLVSRQNDIKQCIIKGFEYEAEVRSINGGQVNVFISSK